MSRLIPRLAALLALAACAPASPTPAPAAAAPAQAPSSAGRVYALSEVDVVPELQNREEIGVAIRANYPGLMRDAGINGVVTVRFIVGSDGIPERSSIQVVQSSSEAFNQGGERVAAKMRFSPARLGGAPVRAYVTLPILFSLQ